MVKYGLPLTGLDGWSRNRECGPSRARRPVRCACTDTPVHSTLCLIPARVSGASLACHWVACRMVFRRRRTVDDPSLPPGQRVYAIGDIHGEADLLTSLLHAIREDSQRRAPAKVTLVFLGDFIDRAGEAAAQLRRWAEEGELVVRLDRREGLDRLPAAFVDLFRGGNEGALVVVNDTPGSDAR